MGGGCYMYGCYPSLLNSLKPYQTDVAGGRCATALTSPGELRAVTMAMLISEQLSCAGLAVMRVVGADFDWWVHIRSRL